ncbi:pilin [Candidatus Nomurabacteria bacterium]|nr:pilin [Candidatus Nomurabacteria bacterium]
MILYKNKNLSLLSRISMYAFVFVVAFSLFAPMQFANAANGDANIPSGGDKNTGVTINTGIKNPLGKSISDIPTFIQTILGFVLLVGVPIIVLAIIYAGFLFVTAQGNSEKLTMAKTTLLYTLIGAALLLGSFVIAKAIKGTVDQISNSEKAK